MGAFPRCEQSPTVSVVEDRSLSASLLSASDGISRLAKLAASLLSNQEATSDPHFFLASVSERYWIPRVVVVSKRERIIGLVYAKERKVGPFGTGIIYSDGSLVPCVIADRVDRERVLHTAIRFLFSCRGVRGLRILLPANGIQLQAFRQALSSLPLDVSDAKNEYHSRLPLPSTYEDFMERLGSKTRRNFRYYRRRFEAAGNHYIETLPWEEFNYAASQLTNKSLIPVNPHTAKRALRMVATARQPLRAGLRSANGEWLGVLGGWYESQTATVIMQLNSDSEHPRESLSVVLRGYVIESLIAKKIQQVLFWAGASDPLRRYTSFVPTVAMYLDARTITWRAFRYVVARTAARYTKLKAASWITPPTARAALGYVSELPDE